MSRYDWIWNRPYDRGQPPYPPRDYGSNFRGRGGGASRGEPGPPWRWEGGRGGGWAGLPPGWRRPRYDRGEYGDAYPGYGGYPGDVGRGTYYGGPRHERQQGPRGGSWGTARGYDAGMTRGTFLPESVYQRHPEPGEPQRHPVDDWPGDTRPEGGDELSDEQIVGAVRRNLLADGWIDAARIQVEVSEHVVTLTGDVDDYLEARYAWDDAWEAAGVRGVINHLTVRTEPASADAARSGSERKPPR